MNDYLPPQITPPDPLSPGSLIFAASHLDHGHIHGQIANLKRVGATLRYVYDPDPAKVKACVERNPEVQVVDDFQRILDDPQISLVTSAAIPNERGPIGCRVMRAGKDYFTDKCPFTTLEQLAEAREVATATGRRYWVNYGELISSEAAWHAGELVKSGAIGDIVHMAIFGPHRLGASKRPDWFFKKQQYGGIITDIASHQVAQFIHYTGAESAEVLHARVGNFTQPAYPELEDFGEAVFKLNTGTSCYSRVDWLTPDGLSVWGDGRTFIVGSKGTIEVRKQVDLARGVGARVFLVTAAGEFDIPCKGKVYLPFYDQLVRDVQERTDTAMPQDTVFLMAELALQAQALADAQAV